MNNEKEIEIKSEEITSKKNWIEPELNLLNVNSGKYGWIYEAGIYHPSSVA